MIVLAIATSIDALAIGVTFAFFKTDMKKKRIGYLTVHAEMDSENEEKEEGKFVRKERYVGSCSRSFYVGTEIQSEDIKASFKNGMLKIEVPKKEECKELPELLLLNKNKIQ